MDPTPRPPQWKYVLEVYVRPGVALACLKLQADCGLRTADSTSWSWSCRMQCMSSPCTAFGWMPARSLPPGKKVRAWRKEGFDDFAPTAVDAARQNIKVAEPEAEAGAFAALATFNCGKRAECDGLAKAQALLHSVIAMRQTPIDFELAAPYVDGGGLACSTHISGSNA